MRIVVIGGGIVGASTAYHVTRPEVTDGAEVEVVVIDQGHAGKATLAGAGIVCPWPSAAATGQYLDLYLAGAGYYPSLIEALAAAEHQQRSIGYRRVGALVVSDHVDDLHAAEERTVRRSAGRREVGRVERISNRAARALFPPLRTGVDALYIEGAARVDGGLLAETMLEEAKADRVTIKPGAATLVVDDHRVTAVRLGDDVVEADRVVVAGGAWTNELLEPLGPGLAVDVEPQKGQIVHLRVDADTSLWPVVMPVGLQYLVGFEDFRVVVGATRETDSGFDTRDTAGGQAQVLTAALAVAPGLADAEILETRVGLRPLATGPPSIGRHPEVDGLVVGTGLGAGGLTMGPLCGRLLAEITLDRQPSFDLATYGP
ncbi:MAG: FAD-binding oxidoreductase [Acidimicrobiia bacterium]|nr:FAD-binding oxidoreductase [Acidimicrobiia bacterium]